MSKQFLHVNNGISNAGLSADPSDGADGDLYYNTSSNVFRQFINGAWTNVGTSSTSGTVTSVALTVPTFLSVSGSPVTSSGTLAVSYSGTALPIANGGTAGTSASAAFNNLSPVTSTGDLIVGNGTDSNARLAIGSTGQVLTVAGGTATWASPASSGTVTSVALSDGSTNPIYNISGSPVTSTGTLTFTLKTENANLVFAGPSSGGAAQPTFRSLVAADIPLISLTSGVSGILPIANGGTNASSAAAAYNNLSPMTTTGDIEYEASAGSAARLAIGSTGQVLTVVAGLPSWQTSSGSGTVTSFVFTNGHNVTGTVTSSTTTPTLSLAPTSSSPSASSFASWDANDNLSANNVIEGYATTATTASGTLTLTVSSAEQQYLTGTAASYIVVLPVTSTLVLGQSYTIVNNSTQTVTVYSSNGISSLQVMLPTSSLVATVILTTGTSAASWSWSYNNSLSTESANLVLAGPASGAAAIPTFRSLVAADFATTVFTAPTVQKFTSSSGTYTTPTSPRGPLYIRIRMIGGGGGGAPSGSGSFGSTTAGGNSTFGTSLLVANGGGAGGTSSSTSSAGGAGGTASLGSGPIGLALTGGSGSNNAFNGSSTNGFMGTAGAPSPFGGGGAAGAYTGSSDGPGGNAPSNTGAGGGGGGTGSANVFTGTSGGAGGFIDAIITSPSATYSYAVGAGGNGGSAGTGGFAGGGGGSGIIIVEEFYQ